MTIETDAQALAASPLGALGVTYQRERYKDYEALSIWSGGVEGGRALVGRLTVRPHDRTLLDALVYAMAGNGAQEST